MLFCHRECDYHFTRSRLSRAQGPVPWTASRDRARRGRAVSKEAELAAIWNQRKRELPCTNRSNTSRGSATRRHGVIGNVPPSSGSEAWPHNANPMPSATASGSAESTSRICKSEKGSRPCPGTPLRPPAVAGATPWQAPLFLRHPCESQCDGDAPKRRFNQTCNNRLEKVLEQWQL
jgi:hypothetical protein